MKIIKCVRREFFGRVDLPSSKSIVNRLLIIAALSENKIALKHLVDSDDTILMQSCLERYKNQKIIDAQNAGTVFRFLTAFLAIQKGEWILTGSARMMERPVKPLVDALRQLGADISYQHKKDFSPLIINGKELNGSKVTIDGSSSSQFISALLLIAPVLKNGLEITISGASSSSPYIDLTIELMKQCGAEITRNDKLIRVGAVKYSSAQIDIEADWSSAAFFYELAALSENGCIILPGLSRQSHQGDAVLPVLFSKLGVTSTFENDGWVLKKAGAAANEFSFDFTDHPDLFIPVAAACAGLGIEFRASGLKNLRIKESDRLESMHNELATLGWRTEIRDEGNFFMAGRDSRAIADNVCIKTCGDHRIAMAFAVLAAKYGSMVLDDVACISKSFPHFLQQIGQLGFDMD